MKCFALSRLIDKAGIDDIYVYSHEQEKQTIKMFNALLFFLLRFETTDMKHFLTCPPHKEVRVKGRLGSGLNRF